MIFIFERHDLLVTPLLLSSILLLCCYLTSLAIFLLCSFLRLRLVEDVIS